MMRNKRLVIVLIAAVAAVWTRPALGTKYIPSPSDPNWDPGTRTYTLATDMSQGLVIMEDNLTLDGAGYTVAGSGYGVYLYQRTGVTIQNLNVQGFARGIYLNNSSNNTLTGNTASENNDGIYLRQSNGNNLKGNIANLNNGTGISLHDSSGNNLLTGNTLTGNTASNNDYGISLNNSSYNTLTGNTASDNSTTGIFLNDYCNNNSLTANIANLNNDNGINLFRSSGNNLTSNTALYNGTGIYLDNSSGNTLADNTANLNNVSGIKLLGSSGNKLTGNTASNNGPGIWLHNNSNNNTMKGNTASENDNGIVLNGSIGNKVYNNNFIDNTTQALVVGGSGNVFNLSKDDGGGNYWSDWTMPDVLPAPDGDGFVDSPYVIVPPDVVQDNLPWADPNGWSTPVNQPPVAVPPGNGQGSITVEQNSPAGASVTLDGSGSSDPDGNPLTYTWTWEGGTATGVNPTVVLPLGTTTVTLTVSDGQLSDTGTVDIIVVEDTTPPTIICPASITLEAKGPSGVPETDPNILTFLTGASASDNCDPSPAITDDAPVDFPIGDTIVVTFTATDASGNSSTCQATVTVVDTTAPTINSVSASPSVLWPPNHKMVEVTVTVECEDICDPAPFCYIVGVMSNEPDNCPGDGNTEPDWEITGDLTVNLRAERAGGGTGRVYTIDVVCVDASGNTDEDTVKVTVPHDKGKGNKGRGKPHDKGKGNKGRGKPHNRGKGKKGRGRK